MTYIVEKKTTRSERGGRHALETANTNSDALQNEDSGNGRGFATISWAIRSNFGVIYSVIGTIATISSESEAAFTVSLLIML